MHYRLSYNRVESTGLRAGPAGRQARRSRTWRRDHGGGYRPGDGRASQLAGGQIRGGRPGGVSSRRRRCTAVSRRELRRGDEYLLGAPLAGPGHRPGGNLPGAAPRRGLLGSMIWPTGSRGPSGMERASRSLPTTAPFGGNGACTHSVTTKRGAGVGAGADQQQAQRQSHGDERAAGLSVVGGPSSAQPDLLLSHTTASKLGRAEPDERPSVGAEGRCGDVGGVIASKTGRSYGV